MKLTEGLHLGTRLMVVSINTRIDSSGPRRFMAQRITYDISLTVTTGSARCTWMRC